MSRRVGIAYLAGLGLLLLAPMFIYPILVMKVLCFALFACAFNLLLGYTGLLSFGHAVFLGSAAYVTGPCPQGMGVADLLGLLAGTGAATLLGWAIGSLAIRRQGIYFAMVTLALAQMVFFFFLQAPFTGGEDGCRACRAARCSASTWPTTSTSITWCWRFLPAPSG
jgi:branched-chain amino acid transport system permease protein